jgi:hypothetical protein
MMVMMIEVLLHSLGGSTVLHTTIVTTDVNDDTVMVCLSGVVERDEFVGRLRLPRCRRCYATQ